MKTTQTLTIMFALAACQGAQPQASSTAGSAEAPPAVMSATSPPPPAAAQAAPGDNQILAFDADRAGTAPAGFSFARTGGGPMGRWIAQAEGDAPSPPNVLAQADGDATDDRYPVAVLDAPSLRDLRLSVKCKLISGEVDQACGLVFRYRDENNYLITRANALEGNVRFYYVKDGKRRQLASWSGRVTAEAWHDYAVEARGDRVQIFWDGQQVLDHRDATFPDAGRVGLWTKADSISYFDDLLVAPLEAAP